MKTRLRYNSKKINEFKSILTQHIKANIKDYLILSILFIIGVMIGVILINNSDEQSKTEINGYIKGFISIIQDEKYEVDKAKLIKISIIENLKIVGIIWLAGTTIIGIPLIYIISAYKGICIGYTISAIILTLGISKRINIFDFCIVFTEHNSNSYCFNA